MKSSRAIIMLALSLLAGVVAVVLAAGWLTQQSSAPAKQIVAVAADVKIGQELDVRMIELIPWAASGVPKGAFTDPAQLAGRVVLTDMARGEPVLESKLAAVGTKGGLSAIIPGGKRAISVRVNEVVGVAGFTLPGNYVDVMVNMEDDQRRQVSKIVLEKILVLAVAQQASRDDSAPKVVNAVTLEVTPEEAERLDLARSVGNLSLVLRSQIDATSTATSGARRENLLGVPVAATPAVAPAPRPQPVAQPAPAAPVRATAPAPSPAERSEGTTVEVIRGVQRSAAQF